MNNIYENIVEEFKKRNCKLLTSKDEYNDILKISVKQNYKLYYTASCGHNHNVFYNVFKYRGTGIVCPNCKNKQIGEHKKEKIKNNDITKLHCIEQEFTFIQNLCEILSNEFVIKKAFDGCLVDIIYKPKNIIEDNWVGIQIKTSAVKHLTYSFHINNNYINCLLLLYCYDDNMMWLIPENIILNQTKISIGYASSKYNIYKINYSMLNDKLNHLYVHTTNFSFDKLNTPINFYQQREQEFRKYRESKISFIQFDYDDMEGRVYDFKIGKLKIQEKVCKIYSKENRYIVCLCKNNGFMNSKQKHIQYDINDNDFYWINCDNKCVFFVIPENILINKGLIGNKNEKNTIFIKIPIKTSLQETSSWLHPYIFDYQNVDRIKLLTLLNIN
jgi:hypothetical protein